MSEGAAERSAPILEVRASGRTLVGPALRYGEHASVRRERFASGGLASMDDPLILDVAHDPALVVATTADRLTVTDSAAALEVRAELVDAPAGLPGSGPLRMVQRGMLSGLSVSFVPLAEHRTRDGIRVIDRFHLKGIGLVDDPEYAGSRVEVRRRSGMSFRASLPTSRRVRCECSGSNKWARIDEDGLDEALDAAFEADSGTVAAFGNYDRPLASVSRGTLRRTGRHQIDIDLPDDEAGRAALAAHDAAGVIVRPTLAPLDGGEGPTVEDGVAVWRQFRIRSFVASATDARQGWQPVDVVGTPSGLLEARLRKPRHIWL